MEKDSHIGGEYAQQIVEKLDGQDYLAVDGLNLPAFGSRSVELSDGAPVENVDCGAVALKHQLPCRLFWTAIICRRLSMM